MKILTVGATPYLFVRNGQMNKDVLKALKQQGHDVVSAVWHHDEGYFLADDTGLHMYEDDDGNELCELYPFTIHTNKSDAALYELMKKIQPDLVISIGDYKEVSFIYTIKAMYPNLFKWIAVFPIDCKYVNEEYKDQIEYADYVISTSEFGNENIQDLCNVRSEFVPYGPDHKIYNKIQRSQGAPTYMCSAKNAQASNLPAYIAAMGKVEGDFRAKLHTNLYDPGDYEIPLLMDRYDANNVELPEKFVSIKDSISNEEMAEEYGEADFFVDVSVKSATAISMLEAMATGCVPIGPNVGRVGEIISQMPEQYRIFIPHLTYIGGKEEEYSVVSIEGLRDIVVELNYRYQNDYSWVERASRAAAEIAARYSKQEFLEKLTNIVKTVMKTESPIAVESF